VQNQRRIALKKGCPAFFCFMAWDLQKATDLSERKIIRIFPEKTGFLHLKSLHSSREE